MDRPEAAINDPGRIRIKAINPTFISSPGLFDAIKYHLDLSNQNFGGFHKEEPIDPLKGASNERIIGAMPLFICDEHWKVAKNLIKPVLGWVTTLHTDGFD